MKKDFDLLTLGEVLLRLSPLTNERLVRCNTLIKQVGGAELNVACGVSLLGLRTGIISKLPDNDLGRFVENSVRFCGVSNDFITFDNSKSARLGTYYYENGAAPRKPSVIYDRNYSSFQKIRTTEFPAKMYNSTKIFHTTGITLALCKNSLNTAIKMIEKFKKHRTLISFDVNFRANLWDGKAAKECIEKILPYVDIFFCSKSTAELTFGKSGDIKDIQKNFCKEYDISIMASTDRIVHSPKSHTFSSTVYNSKENAFYTEQPYEKIDVVDRIGSGDAYIAGFLYGLIKYNGSCQKALEYGNASSAIKNTIPGDIPCSKLSELNDVIKSHQNIGLQTEMNR